MKKFTFEVLAKSKTGNKIFFAGTNDKKEAVSKLNNAGRKGFSALLIGLKDGKKIGGAAVGPKVDWSKFAKIVEVTFGDKHTFTYETEFHWEVGDAMHVQTPYGERMCVVASESQYVHIDRIFEIEERIGYELKILEDQIIRKEVD